MYTAVAFFITVLIPMSKARFMHTFYCLIPTFLLYEIQTRENSLALYWGGMLQDYVESFCMRQGYYQWFYILSVVL